MAKISKIVVETEKISSFRLQPEQMFNYLPGQWMHVTITQNLRHHFTISSSPTEDFLQFTTINRPESEYKQALFALKEGATIDIEGPRGSFTLDESNISPQLFIAGGIGITPFRSMLKYNRDKQLNLPIKLIYLVKSKLQGAFINELTETLVVESESEGRLDATKIKTLVPDWQERTWWLCGPPAMVDAFMTIGQQLGMPSEKIKSEEFSGY